MKRTTKNINVDGMTTPSTLTEGRKRLVKLMLETIGYTNIVED